MNTSLAKSSTTVDRYCAVFADILSQAVTGELVGMQNFASMVELYDDVEEKIEAVEHTENEKCHAVTFESLAEELGVSIIVNLEAPYWKQMREALVEVALQLKATRTAVSVARNPPSDWMSFEVALQRIAEGEKEAQGAPEQNWRLSSSSGTKTAEPRCERPQPAVAGVRGSVSPSLSRGDNGTNT